jgi:Uma2 family endonuclease
METELEQDQRLLLHDVSWQEYETLRSTFSDRPGIRMAYLEGTLEIMTLSPRHEGLKKVIARLIETYAEERNLNLNGYGSTTFRRAARERGLEPDECYCLGRLADIPDLALEIVVTHGGIDRLAIYAGLEVPELWFYRDGALRMYALAGDGYTAIPRSLLLPELDIDLLSRHLLPDEQTRAVREFRRELRGG